MEPKYNIENAGYISPGTTNLVLYCQHSGSDDQKYVSGPPASSHWNVNLTSRELLTPEGEENFTTIDIENSPVFTLVWNQVTTGDMDYGALEMLRVSSRDSSIILHQTDRNNDLIFALIVLVEIKLWTLAIPGNHREEENN